ncbi:mucin-17 [Dunckerocampus dactyliophorus]|uniref:mucin-17 n=1 Tax=Dunckerocampus dactyliophorus TaxID=161453 RepID=UPI0024050575|nr:mucin-17 [Dunckerocampus dactyliophorus]
MDVQTENMDPSPCESSGKIRKGFKLFGKRKPGSIFSIKNNKSPVTRSQTLDGLPDGAAPDSESEADKEKAQGVSQGDGEHTEEELTGEMAAARNSISSTGSAKSLSFFSRLRGARRGGGDRRVQTVSQPVCRQRPGLKGLFGSVKFRSKDKEDKVDAPPSPLLMSSRSNSVEIIKEDLSLTPKSHPRSLESPEKASSEATQGSPTAAGDMRDGNVAPALPGESSLGSLLEDISSLLTFESISGGDIMADVEAEWGKARCAASLEAPEFSASTTSHISRQAAASPPTSTSSPAAAPTLTSSSVATPILSTFTKSSTLTIQANKPSSDSTPTFEQPSTGITIKSANIKPSFPPVTSTTPPKMSTPSATMVPTTTTLINQTSVDKTNLNSSVGKLASSDTAAPHPQGITSVSKPPPVATPPLLPPVKPPTQSPPAPASWQTSSYTKPQSVSAKIESALNTVPPFISTITTVTPSVPAVSIPAQSGMPSKNSIPPDCTPPETSPPMAKQTLVSVDTTSHARGQSLVSQSKTPSIPVTVSKDPPVPACIPVSVAALSGVPTPIDPPIDPPAPAHVAVPAYKSPPTLTHVPVPVSKSPPALTHDPVTLSKMTPSRVHDPVAVSKSPPVPAQIPVTSPKSPPAPVTSLPTSPVPLPSEAAASNKMTASEASEPTNGHLSSPSSTDAEGAKMDEQLNGSRMDPSKERRTQVKALSKIPVVGGGRAGKQPVRDSQHAEDDSSRDPPTPVLEQDRPLLDFHDTESRDKGVSVEVHVPITKPSQEGSQLPHQSKPFTNVPRDSKIPVKHGVSQIPQAKEVPRTKIPVSKVPVRRAGNKPTATSVTRK